ncbi:MAG TPA: TIGR04282 family arsenosugar biosynthesis glycosyltransferase [Stellaceae bacterium]|nr:TIGR04282 family arsenosugar biosynthesis glycosyltransferase [Stellaceae bacterium]
MSDLSACCAIAIMAKASVAGAVKTRLVPPLSPAEAAAFNTCCLADVAANIGAAAQAAPIRGFAAYDPAGAEDFFAAVLPDDFALLPPRPPVPLYSGIGHSLYHAARDLLAAGFGSLCLVNADSPTLPTQFLVEAVRLLQEPGDRVVLGPAADGGYYLIGLKRLHAPLFQAIAWSTAQVCRQTVARAEQLGIAVAALGEWYDVDDGASLALLARELLHGDGRYRGGFAAPRTTAFVKELAARDGSVLRWTE